MLAGAGVGCDESAVLWWSLMPPRLLLSLFWHAASDAVWRFFPVVNTFIPDWLLPNLLDHWNLWINAPLNGTSLLFVCSNAVKPCYLEVGAENWFKIFPKKSPTTHRLYKDMGNPELSLQSSQWHTSEYVKKVLKAEKRYRKTEPNWWC